MNTDSKLTQHSSLAAIWLHLESSSNGRECGEAEGSVHGLLQ